MQVIINKYLAALLQIAIVGLTAFVAIPAEEFNSLAALQLAILVIGSFVTFFVPLVNNDNPLVAGVLKTGAAVLVAILTAVIPLVQQGGELTGPQIAIVALAALSALATQIGVSVRQDQRAIANATPETTPTDIIDPH